MERIEAGGNENSWERGTKDLAGANQGWHESGSSENGKGTKILQSQNEQD